MFTCRDGKGGKLSSQASKMLYKPPGAVYIASYKEPLDQSDCWKLFVQLWNYTKASKGDFCLIGWFVTLVLRLFLSARCRKSQKQRWRPKERFRVDFALLLVLEFQENVGGFLLCPPFQNGRKMLGDKAQTFRRLLFSLLLARNRFPRCFLLPFVGWKNVPQQVPKTSSYRTCVTFREKVVCRKCCRKLINKSAIVKRSLLYLFTLYRFNTGINLIGNQCDVTEEIALSTLNLFLFLKTF